MTISDDLRGRLRDAFSRGTLLAHSVGPSGEVAWQPVQGVHRAEVSWERIVEVSTSHGSMTLTGGHRVYVAPTEKVDAEDLEAGHQVLSIGEDGTSCLIPVVTVRRLAPRRFMYDLTVAEWHNFLVHRPAVVVSNSPDRNYRFRPPEGEGTIGCYNQVFGYVWTDEEFEQYLLIALDKWNMHPPRTENLTSIDQLCQQNPSWRAALLWGALVTAAQALAYNWVVNEFDYSIGGISLNLERSSKYMDLKRNAEEQWDKLTEAKSRTVKYVRGLQQPRFGRGVRSAFGPYVGKGVLSPRNFVVALFCLRLLEHGVYFT